MVLILVRHFWWAIPAHFLGYFRSQVITNSSSWRPNYRRYLTLAQALFMQFTDGLIARGYVKRGERLHLV